MATALAAVTTDSPSTARVLEDLRTLVASVLNRPNPDWFAYRAPECDCARCQALRRVVWLCSECGYDGPWVIEPCECREGRAESIPLLERRIAAAEAGHPLDGYDACYLEHMRRDLAKFRARPDARCMAHDDPAVQARIRARSYQCGHGQPSCPTCGSTIDGTGTPMEGATLAATIRRLRSALAEAGAIRA